MSGIFHASGMLRVETMH